MIIEIKYSYEPNSPLPFYAKTVFRDKTIFGCSDESFTDAKVNLLEVIRNHVCQTGMIPPDELIEIDV